MTPASNATPRPGLTVVVPFRDCEDSLSATVASLRANEHPDVWFRLIDDGSRDETAEELLAFAEDRPRVSVERLAHPRGFGAARNLALAGADTEWIAFLDGDDFVEAGYYPALLAAADEAGCDFLRTDHVRVDGVLRSVRKVTSEHRGGTVGDPREAILPLGRETAVESTDVWAGVYHHRLLARGLLDFRPDLTRLEGLAWMWRLHLNTASFSVSRLRGVYHHGGVGPSGSADLRGSFELIKAYDAMVGEVRLAPDADRFLPKALYLYADAVAAELRRADGRDKARRKTLTLLCAESLAALPRKPLKQAVKALDKRSRATIKELVAL